MTPPPVACLRGFLEHLQSYKETLPVLTASVSVVMRKTEIRHFILRKVRKAGKTGILIKGRRTERRVIQLLVEEYRQSLLGLGGNFLTLGNTGTRIPLLSHHCDNKNRQ